MSGRPRGRIRPNRTALALLGLLLLAAGGYLLTAHLDELSWVDAADPLVPGTELPPDWVCWAIAAVAIGIGLASLRWAVAQWPRNPAAVRWRARADSGDLAVLDSARIAAPLVADLETYPGVRSATAWVTGSGRRPRVHLLVSAAPDTDVVALRARISTHALPRLRQALEVAAVPVTLELRLEDGPVISPARG
ncbi:alkaline shock response membrane anchor protein AmaP [Nocardia sp. alder85J]|uniref:alkaline shock response membrane anchor protein AmaP n=1 Tax=Nocardia sp. alder85J TaxID=2862949 RepID=UPI001CD379F3|nr:alkaline shock response membrane anchor protein AmaP [Nocardia sp. alder85J]MCX4097044.1 alkaline shock response membrane anchor protein AmaP [Nocardia sp. alder85J]